MKRLGISNTGRYYLWLCALMVMVLPIRIPAQKMVFISETRKQENTAITVSRDRPAPGTAARLRSLQQRKVKMKYSCRLFWRQRQNRRLVPYRPHRSRTRKKLAKEWIPLLWAGGAFLLILRYIFEKILLKRKIARFSVPASQMTKAIFQEAAGQAGIRRNVRIRGLRVPASPFSDGDIPQYNLCSDEPAGR